MRRMIKNLLLLVGRIEIQLMKGKKNAGIDIFQVAGDTS
jgi:hypothetical protein